MKARLGWTLAVVVALGGLARAQPGEKKDAAAGPAREKLIGAWHLVAMEEPGADGELNRTTHRNGTLIYTHDGHMSVQIQFPESEAALSNDYVLKGYEASFGSYDVNEEAHTITHHVEGSLTRGLVGKHLTRVYRFSDGHLIIRSARPEEHWSVTWEHY
jgi:lipocalin-like protein